MKIVFNIYSENIITEESVLHYSKIITTDMTISQVDAFINCNEGYSSLIESGIYLTFWDYYCYLDNVQFIIDKINSIPTSDNKEKNKIKSKQIIIKEYNPGNKSTFFYPNSEEILYFRLSRFECGASGFGETIAFLTNNPIFLGLLVNGIYDVVKLVISKIFCHKKQKNSISQEHEKEILYLSVNKFLRNFSKYTQISKDDCCIIGISRYKQKLFRVSVRTINNELYKVTLNKNGKIIEINNNIDKSRAKK